MSSSSRLCDPAHAHIDLRDLIPGRIVHNTGLRQIEYTLEHAHGVRRTGSVDAVRRDSGDGWIVLRDPVELMLDLQYFAAGGADAQVIAGPGGRHTGYGHGCVDIHVAAIVIAYDLDGSVAFVTQILGTPLAQAAAGHILTVAVGGEDRLSYTGAGEIVGEDGVYQPVNICIDVSAADPFLIVGGG